MANQKPMKKPRKKSPTLSEIKDSQSILTRIRLNAKRRKALAHTGPTSTPKTSVDMTQKGLTWRQARIYQADAEELLWRYKALQVINQRLRSKLTDLESKILETPMDKISNIIPSTSTDESGRLTYEAGQWKTSSNI